MLRYASVLMFFACGSLSGAPVPAPVDTASSLFAGGSFWCLEAAFDSLSGVDSAVSGYVRISGAPDSAGSPAFEATSDAWVQAVRVHYRPGRIPYRKLADIFWRNIDPTRRDGQFTDAGPQYRTFLFYSGEAERKVAGESRDRLAKSKRFRKPIVTELAPAGVFHRGEAEHQDYARRNAPRYLGYYRFSGREAFFKQAWGGHKGKP